MTTSPVCAGGSRLPASSMIADLGAGGDADFAGLARAGRQEVARHLMGGLGHAVGFDHGRVEVAFQLASAPGAAATTDEERMKRKRIGAG